jgi:hypothetical protein
MNHPIPTIAIHGVGKHEPGEIEARVKATVGRGQDFDVSVAEFNWDQYVDHRSVRSPIEALEDLQRVCASFHAAATVGLKVRRDGLDTWLSEIQLICCRLLRHLIAIVIATFFGIPAIIIVVLLPTTLLQIAPIWPTRELRWIVVVVVPIIFYLAAALVASIVALGCARAVFGRSAAPVRSAITCVVLTCLAPLLAILSTPLSVSWSVVGGLVIFFSLFGILASVLDWLAPDVPRYSAWRDFAIAPYLIGIVVGLAALQALRYFLGQVWYEGPIKVLLDIARYVGDPKYRLQTLEELAAFIRSKEGNSENLVIVAHSLGTIIALDYLCNWSAGDRDRSILLITLGSPYRRFFLSWLPGVLFDRRMLNTVGRISARYRSFRWLNVYRPWDYIGKSLRLTDSAAGADQSTRQYRRLNGHGDYWGDDDVLSTIKLALTSLPQPTAPSEVPGPAYVPPLDERELSSKAPHFFILTAALACLSVGWMLYSFVGQHSELAKTRAAIDAHGVRAEVFVSHREIPDVADEMLTAQEFQFIGAGLEMPPYQLSQYLPASVAQQRLDYRRLKQFVRSNCVLERKPGRFESDRFLICTSKEPIEIAYLSPASKLDFYLPGFEWKFYYRDIPSWFLYPLVTIVFASIPGVPFIILTATLYAVFLGRDPDEELTEIS